MDQTLEALRERDGKHPLHEIECGRITEAAFASVQRALCEAAGHEVTLVGFSEMLDDLLPNEPMIRAVAKLRRGPPDGAAHQQRARVGAALAGDGADRRDLGGGVDSANVGMRKPDPEIYELTVQRLGVPAEECLFVDDFEHNCEAAQAVGMAAVVYREPEQAVAEIRAALSAAVG